MELYFLTSLSSEGNLRQKLQYIHLSQFSNLLLKRRLCNLPDFCGKYAEYPNLIFEVLEYVLQLLQKTRRYYRPALVFPAFLLDNQLRQYFPAAVPSHTFRYRLEVGWLQKEFLHLLKNQIVERFCDVFGRLNN